MATFDYRMEDGPDPGIGDRAAIAAGIEQAYAVNDRDQAEAHDFFVANGADVVGGHPQVRHPGAQGDPDPQLDEGDY